MIKFDHEKQWDGMKKSTKYCEVVKNVSKNKLNFSDTKNRFFL